MTELKLIGGEIALIDDDDLSKVLGQPWRIVRPNPESDLKYVGYTTAKSGKRQVVMLHRVITDATDEMLVDHRDGNGLDNRRNNIRICCHAQNMQNRKRHSNNRSGFKGVYFHKQKQKWCANITAFGVRTVIGYFTDPKEAAAAYDESAIRLHGEFARINFPVSAVAE